MSMTTLYTVSEIKWVTIQKTSSQLRAPTVGHGRMSLQLQAHTHSGSRLGSDRQVTSFSALFGIVNCACMWCVPGRCPSCFPGRKLKRLQRSQCVQHALVGTQALSIERAGVTKSLTNGYCSCAGLFRH